MPRQSNRFPNLVAILCVMTLLLSSRLSAAQTQPADAEYVSMIKLITEPQKYAGKRILVLGVFVIATEERFLYLSPADAEVGNFANSIVFKSEDKFQKYQAREHELNFKWVSVEGTFDTHIQEPGVFPSGAAWAYGPGIRDITSLWLQGEKARQMRYFQRDALPQVIPDEKTAVAIARAIWAAIYGGSELARREPITAELRQGVWTVMSSRSNPSDPLSYYWLSLLQKNGEVLYLRPKPGNASSSLPPPVPDKEKH
jgi:hypothetical protein